MATILEQTPNTAGPHCYHCGEPVNSSDNIIIYINNKEFPACCYGCKAVAETIHEFGLADYYRFRSDLPDKPDPEQSGKKPDFKTYDRADVQQAFVTNENPDNPEATLLIDNMVCPACAWLVEKHLSSLSGMNKISVNFTARKAVINWNKNKLPLSIILKNIYQLGYKAYPFNSSKRQELIEQERKKQLLRIGLAGLLGMQVMMIAIAMYAGEWTGMEVQYKTFLQWISLILSFPVIVYSAAPFYFNSWRAILNRKINMDVPVATGISIAFIASIIATVTGKGVVYYDSVVMLVFLLLCGRYLEFVARNKAAKHLDNLARVIPSMAVKVKDENNNLSETVVPISDLKKDDIIIIKPGETIPVDGIIYKGNSSINESVINGEFFPALKKTGQNVIAGSVNIDTPIYVLVITTGNQTYLSRLCSLVYKTQSYKPAVTLLVDNIAAYFLTVVLFLAAVTAYYWWHTNPEIWLYATVSVLVISCPCALSLATPTALTTSSSRLLRQGIALINSNALQTLTSVTHIAFDKTGTLTEGKLYIDQTVNFSDLPDKEILLLARSLESGSEHPIAQAFAQTGTKLAPVENLSNYPGAGLTGEINKRIYFLGSFIFLRQKLPGLFNDTHKNEFSDQYSVYLADQENLLAAFTFGDKVRPSIDKMICTLKSHDIKPLIVSGDFLPAVAQCSRECGIEEFHARLSPEDKLSLISRLQQAGGKVAMIGDGINDAPVMARADVAIAMESGTDLSKIHADVLLLDSRLANITELIQVAKKTKTVIGQNITWAVFYNLLSIPAAMTGIIAPWLAAIGMSLSSILVISNSLRLGWIPEKNAP